MKRGWIAACLAAAGCSILALSEEITQSECLDDLECDILNREEAEDFDPCNIYQCGQSNRCERLPPDMDRDGALPPACVETGMPFDCRDDDEEVGPGKAEVCDGKDNDCDIGIDEGMLAVAHAEVLYWNEPARELAFAWKPEGPELGVAYSTGDAANAGFAVVRPARPSSSGPLKLAGRAEALHGSGLSVGLRVGRFILALTEAETQLSWVGYVNGVLEGSSLNVAERLRVPGLSCPDGAACANQRARLGTLESQVLVSRILDPDPAARSCEEPSAHPAVLNALIDNFTELSERTPAPVQLDRSSDAVPPALVTIDATAVRSATEQFGWLAAYPDPEGDLIVQRIRPEPEDLLASLRLRLPRGNAPISHVQLALGAISNDRMEIGLAAQLGCGADARVHFGVLQLTWDITGRTELRMYRELSLLAGDDTPAEQPVLAWNRVEASWGIAYITPDGVFARILNPTGVPRGDDAYPIRDVIPSLRDLAIVPILDADTGAFGVVTYVERTDSSPPYALDVAYLRACRLGGGAGDAIEQR